MENAGRYRIGGSIQDFPAIRTDIVAVAGLPAKGKVGKRKWKSLESVGGCW